MPLVINHFHQFISSNITINQISMSSSPNTASYWCYQCTSTVTISDNHVVCPFCHGGFIQLLDPTNFIPEPQLELASRPPSSGFSRQRRRNGTSFNPLIVLRSPPENPLPESGERNYDLYYNAGVGAGLRQLPPSMSETLLGSGFEVMLDRISEIGFNLWARPENPPANKHAIAALPTIQIEPVHVESESHCAVCKDAFTLGSEAIEMPCKHIYHSDCILPWLNQHSSCPVCRVELPSDDPEVVPGRPDTVGLTIYRLPSGGFAVGRFVGRGAMEMSGVFSEVDGTLTLNGGIGTGTVFGPWMRWRRGDGFRRFFGNLGSIFRRRRSGSVTGGATVRRIESVSGSGSSIFGRYMLGRNSYRDSVLSER